MNLRNYLLYLLIFGTFSCQRKDPLKELFELMEMVENKWSKETCKEFKNMEEEKAVLKQYRPGIGMWLRNTILNKDSKYTDFFKSYGIFNIEDMSAIVLTSLHRKLNNRPIEFEGQCQFYIDYWEEVSLEKEERKKPDMPAD